MWLLARGSWVNEKRVLSCHKLGLATALATLLIRLLFGVTFTDLGPFRALRYDALMRLEMQDRNFGWTAEMQVKAARLDLRTVEVPVPPTAAAIGTSKITGTLRWHTAGRIQNSLDHFPLCAVASYAVSGIGWHYSMQLVDYDFDLPDALIAQRPPPERDQARLLLLNRANDSLQHLHFGTHRRSARARRCPSIESNTGCAGSAQRL